MEPQSGAGAISLILAWGAPMVLLAVVTIRYFQRRRKRSRAARVRERIEASAAAARAAHGTDLRTGGDGMRRADRVITDPARIDAILRSATVCRLALAVANEPYVVPLSFGLAGGTPRRLYFHGAPGGRKLDMLRENPRACFEVEGRVDLARGERPCDWTMLYESIIGYGQLTELSDPEEKRAGLECIMRHHGAEGPFDFPDSMIAKTAVIRLDVTELSGKSNRPEEGDS